jgi:outer membrane protein assembly factor BamB
VTSSARPVSDERAVYFLGFHTVRAVDKATGRTLWATHLTYPAGVDISHLGYGLAEASGVLIAGDIDVFGLDPTSGAIVWRFAPREQFSHERSYQRLGTNGFSVFVGGVRGNVYAIDARSGMQLWAMPATAFPDTDVRVFNPVVSGADVYVSFSNDHGTGGLSTSTDVGVTCLNAATGAMRWSRVFSSPTSAAPNEPQGVVLAANRVVSVAADGSVLALDRSTGATADSVTGASVGFTIAGSASSEYELAANDTLVAIASWSGNLAALDARDLHHVYWKSPLHYGAVWDVLIDSSRVYTTFAGGQFAVSSLATGAPIWWIEPFDFRPESEAILYAPAIDTDRIFVGADRDVYAFKRK